MRTQIKYVMALLCCSIFLGCTPMPSNAGTAVPAKAGVSASAARPNLERLPNGHYRMLNDWQVRVNNRQFTVQQGYTSNGITGPQSAKTFMGDHVNAPETWCAMFHDWCFTQNYLTRQQADDYFVALLYSYDVPAYKIKIMETTVKSYSTYKGVKAATSPAGQ